MILPRTRSAGVAAARRSIGSVLLLTPVLVSLDATESARSIRSSAPAAERIEINDNRKPAGVFRNGVLTLRLEARSGEWHPDGDRDAGIVVRAFGEEGKSLQIPAPLVRVPRGTEIHAFIRNSLDSTLIVHGFDARDGAGPDTVQVAAGRQREVRFKAGTVGTFYYWGTTNPTRDVAAPRGVESQLAGAFVVDAKASSGEPKDRVIVLGFWNDRPLAPGVGAPANAIIRFVMNGKAWPHTERLTYTVGDTVRFRLVNVSSAPHPMHLHGFYFKVDTRGDGRTDSSFVGGSPRFAVTERAAPGRTFSLTWVPERAGNWLFHCHDNLHVLRSRPLDGKPLPPEHHVDAKNHALEMMGGLTMGIEVKGKGPPVVTNDDRPRRTLRLIARVDSGGTDEDPAFGYVLQEGTTSTPTTSPLLPGPTILLTRGEPVAIRVINELPEATAVHWHGIELDSYYDGVAGFSGAGTRISPVIAPRDSFEARFTPPRAGTFMYHPHADEVRQQQAGLTGTIIVLPPGERFDREHDIPLLVSTPRRRADAGTVFLNGTNTPSPLTMRVGDRYRLRLVNIHTARPSMIARLQRDSTLLTWRAIAKDGMDLPRDQATVRPAMQQSGNGEAYDFEFIPTAPGDLRFTMSSAAGQLLVTQMIRVRE